MKKRFINFDFSLKTYRNGLSIAVYTTAFDYTIVFDLRIRIYKVFIMKTLKILKTF